MMDIKQSAEQSFLDEVKRAFVITIGSKRQGKTYLLCKVLMYCINNNIFEEYHLILPEWEGERDNKYEFLKNRKNVFIYDRYHEIVAEKMLKIYATKHIMFAIDDASGEFCLNVDDSFKKLATRNEHKKLCCIWLNVHSSKRVLSPIIRQQITNLFIFKMSNYKLLKDIYEEYFQMFIPDFNIFYDNYQKIVLNGEHEAIMYALDGNSELNGITQWNVLKEEVKVTKEKAKTKYQEIDPTKLRMENQINIKYQKRELEDELKPKPKTSNILSFIRMGKK